MNIRTPGGILRALKGMLASSLLVFGVGVTSALATDSQTVTFDNVPGANLDSELDGQFPRGMIDWGSGSWYLSGPWKDLSGNSISFNGDGISSATFSFVSPHQLIRLDAYNGGDDPAVVTLSCAGQPDRQVNLGTNEIRTVDTGWSGTCAQVTVSTSNGWYTNFDNLVIQ